MKFCTKCGGQCVDEAVICVSCGAPITPDVAPAAPAVPGVTPSASPVKSDDNKLAIFDFLSSLSIVLYVAFSIFSVVFAWVSSSGYFYLDEIAVVLAGIVSVLSLAFAIIRLVAGLTHKDNLEVKLSGIFRLITALIMVLVSVLAIFEHV